MKQLPGESESTEARKRTDMARRNLSVCASCLRPLERCNLHDLSSSKRYCGAECYPRRMMVSGFAGSSRSNEPVRARDRLADADRRRRLSAVRQRVGQQSRLTLETHSI
jgi:hypothetical protein